MANTLKLPVGIENFEEIRKLGFYYIDETRLIEQLLQGWGKVTLFTRPRRLGKTLNMSMLKSFFEIGTDKSLFDCLYISGNKELCDEYMGKYAQNRKDTLITYLLEQRPSEAMSDEQLEVLTPWSEKVQNVCKTKM